MAKLLEWACLFWQNGQPEIEQEEAETAEIRPSAVWHRSKQRKLRRLLNRRERKEHRVLDTNFTNLHEWGTEALHRSKRRKRSPGREETVFSPAWLCSLCCLL